MNKIFIVFRFELKEYFRNKGLIISAIVFALLIIGLSFLPKIIDSFSSNKSVEDAKKAKPIYALILTDNLRENEFDRFLQKALNVNVQIIENSSDTMENLKTGIKEGRIEKAFVFSRDTDYTYILNNSSLSDKTKTDFDLLLKSFLQKMHLSNMGLTVSEIDNLIDIKITSTPIVLGNYEGVSYGMTTAINVLMYIAILTFSSVLSYNIITEKTSKTVEVLVSSTSTFNLLFGKVFALLVFIILEGLFLGVVIFFSIQNIGISSEISQVLLQAVGFKNLIYILIFLLLGITLYLFFTTIFAAKINRIEEAGSASLPTIILILIPYFIAFNIQSTESLFFKILSFVPFFSPILMPARFMYNDIPTSEILASIILLAGTAILIAYIASKLYQKDVLSSGSKTSKLLSALSIFSKKR